MRSSVTVSFGLHVAVILAATFGLPNIWKPPVPVESPPLVVELVTLGDVTNVPTRPKDPEPPKPEQAKPEPPKPEPKPVETPPPAKSEPPPPQPQAVAPPEPKPAPAPELKPEPKPEPKPQAPAELNNTKPTKKPKAPEDFDSVLKNLAKALPQQKVEPKAEKKAESKPSFEDLMSKAIPSNRRNVGDPDKPLTMTEQDLIRNIFNKAMQRCWNAPVGAKDARDLVIPIRVALGEDGTVLRVSLEESTFGKSDFWKAAAESAMRAIRVCSPYSELPKNLYSNWKDTILSFNPKELLGG